MELSSTGTSVSAALLVVPTSHHYFANIKYMLSFRGSMVQWLERLPYKQRAQSP